MVAASGVSSEDAGLYRDFEMDRDDKDNRSNNNNDDDLEGSDSSPASPVEELKRTLSSTTRTKRTTTTSMKQQQPLATSGLGPPSFSPMFVHGTWGKKSAGDFWSSGDDLFKDESYDRQGQFED